LEKWHRHLGVYGICVNEGRLLVIHKNGGPYINRFDLPGGTVEPDESLFKAIHREFAEETGITIEVIQNIGVCEYLVPHVLPKRQTTHIHHVAVFYVVKHNDGTLAYSNDLMDNDSKGADWIDSDLLSDDNSSPLVMEAVKWLNNRNEIPLGLRRLDSWTVK
jgi:ADP-ribose pyrophosphatase YjhB (NUDIX family)